VHAWPAFQQAVEDCHDLVGEVSREILLHRLNSTRTILAYRAMHAAARRRDHD
jgi:hypothetical protein